MRPGLTDLQMQCRYQIMEGGKEASRMVGFPYCEEQSAIKDAKRFSENRYGIRVIDCFSAQVIWPEGR